MIGEPEIAEGNLCFWDTNKQTEKKKKDKKIPIGRHAKMDYFLCIANVYA